jgi:L-lactate utilization protein LutC
MVPFVECGRFGGGRSAVTNAAAMRMHSERNFFRGQRNVILPAATGALLGAACGVADTGSIVMASVAPS